MNAPTTLAALRGAEDDAATADITKLPEVRAGFDSLQSYQLLVRIARGFASSELVPETYRSVITKYNRDGSVKTSRENPSGLANCMVALNMAFRLKADPIMVMQNLVPVEGKFSWASQWVISMINGSGKFASDLRFDMKPLGRQSLEYTESYWDNDEQKRKTRKLTATIDDVQCVAYVIEKNGNRLDGPPITISLAVKEGWYGRNGSKWQTMADMMLRYRAGAWFGRLYTPELLMGLRTIDEQVDIVDVDPEGNVTAVTTETLKRSVGAATLPADEVGAPQAPAQPAAPALEHQPAQTLPLTGLPADEAARQVAPVAATTEQAAPRPAPAPAAPAARAGGITFDVAGIAARIETCTDLDALDFAAEQLRAAPASAEKVAALRRYTERRADLTTQPATPRPAATPARRTGATPRSVE